MLVDIFQTKLLTNDVNKCAKKVKAKLLKVIVKHNVPV